MPSRSLSASMAERKAMTSLTSLGMEFPVLDKDNPHTANITQFLAEHAARELTRG